MDKLRSLLLPLAVLLAGVVVFEFGARYGAANMRAYGIAGELAFPVNLYVQAGERLQEQSRQNMAFLIDYRIAAGAMHRKTWYLGKEAEKALDAVLAYALSVRGDEVIKRFTPTEEDLAKVREEKGEDAVKEVSERMAKLREAILDAKENLIDNAPPVQAVDTAPVPPTAEPVAPAAEPEAP